MKFSFRLSLLFLAALVLAGCTNPAASSPSGTSDGSGESETEANHTDVPSFQPPEMPEPAEAVTWDNTFWIAASPDIGLLESEQYVRDAVKAHAEAGVNLILWWAHPALHIDAFLEECERYGVYTILRNNSNITGAAENWNEITEEEFEKTVAPYKDHPQVLGFENWDEPLHEDVQYTQMLWRKEMAQKYFPGKLSFINLCPSYGPYTWGNGLFTEQVETLLERVDPAVLAVDYYAYSVSGESPEWTKNFLWRDLGYLRKRAIETDKPLWFYFQGWDFDKQESGMTPVQLRLQMNAGLAYGCRWLCYWTSKNSVVDITGKPSAQYAEVAALNTEVMNVGRYLMDKKPGELYHAGLAASEKSNATLAATFFCSKIEDSAVFVGLPAAHVILSTFTDDDGHTYVVAVNRHQTESVQDTVELKSPRSIFRLDAATGETSAVGQADSLSLELAPGALQLFILE